MMTPFKISIIALAIAVFASRAGTIDITFLRDTNSMCVAVQTLRESGIKETAISSFAKAVASHNSHPIGCDLSQFPRETGGFYSFPSPQALVTAMPGSFWNADHEPCVTCYDLVTMLIGEALIASNTVEKNPYPRGLTVPICPSPTNFVMGAYYSSADEAYEATVTSYQRECITSTSGFIWSPSLKILALGLREYIPLDEPITGNDTNFLLRLAAKRDDQWERLSVTPPLNPQLVLIQVANTGSQTLRAVHCGVLFHGTNGYFYVEKAGSSGPFVAMRLSHVEDLLPYFSFSDPTFYGERANEIRLVTANSRVLGAAPPIPIAIRRKMWSSTPFRSAFGNPVTGIQGPPWTSAKGISPSAGFQRLEVSGSVLSNCWKCGAMHLSFSSKGVGDVC
jgi:hypothetical protein